jgi:sugar lactone lactonase YvrE
MHRSAVAVGCALALLTAVPFRAQETEAALLQRTLAEGTDAYKAKAYDKYLERYETLAKLRPAHPTILYRLAGAYALNDRAADTARILDRLGALQLTYDVSKDPDFVRVVDNPAVRDANARLQQIRERRIGTSQVAWTIPDPTFIPEGVTYDPVSRALFVSSQYQRRIVRIDPAGKVTPFTPETNDLWMVFGMAVDAKRRLLWAVSTAEPEMKGFTPADAGRAGVFAFHIDTGKLVHKLVLDPGTPRHYFDDVAVRPDGRVYISNGGQRSIYTVDPEGKSLEVFVPPGTIQGPNGLALAPDGRHLYVADYAGFIFRIDLETKAAERMAQPADATLNGIDGLSYFDGNLIGVQNGVKPARVLKLRLSGNGRAIAAATILDMNHPEIEEPTLGVVAGDTFYYVANSHGGAMRAAKGNLQGLNLTPPAILKLPLSP